MRRSSTYVDDVRDHAGGHSARSALTGAISIAIQLSSAWSLPRTQVAPTTFADLLHSRQQTQLPGSGNGLHTAVNTQFAVDVVGVGSHGIGREEQLSSDFAVGEPLGQEVEHFQFAGGQGFNQN